jgi:hypothetical protein
VPGGLVESWRSPALRPCDGHSVPFMRPTGRHPAVSRLVIVEAPPCPVGTKRHIPERISQIREAILRRFIWGPN